MSNVKDILKPVIQLWGKLENWKKRIQHKLNGDNKIRRLAIAHFLHAFNTNEPFIDLIITGNVNE